MYIICGDVMVSIDSQEKFASDLVNYVVSRVAGNHPDDQIISERPGKSFLIGTLAARKADDSDKENDVGKAASIRASRLRVSVLMKKSEIDSTSEVNVTAFGNVYYLIKAKGKSVSENSNAKEETQSNLDDKHLWKRLNFSHECKLGISTNSESNIDFSKSIEAANNDALNSKFIPQDLWSAKVYITVTAFNDDYVLVSFNYENLTREPESSDKFERTLFDCRLEVDLDSLKNKEFCDEYTYDGYKQRYYYDFRTINCQARWMENRRKFITEHFGKFEQENIRPKEKIPDLDLSFSNLMSPQYAISSLEGFLSKMKEYLRNYRNNIPENVSESEFQKRVADREYIWGERIKLTNHFQDLINKIEKGLTIIKSNSKVREAFFKTNETFNNYYLNQDTSYPNASWRLFQLAFFLTGIESIIEHNNLDVVDVLHVDTGGGKSEAYFALVIFTSFYERSMGKKDGVSAIVKFPLRMLSIQQLERISSVIIHAESVRKKYPDVFSGTPFSLGYYVGNDDDFPDLYVKVKDRLYENGTLISPSPQSKIISKCPLCPSDQKGYMRLINDPIGKRVIHKCDKCGNESYIYQSDREVFRWRPTVLVSTVDKWAGLASQRRVRSLLGGNGSMCPEGHGFISSGDVCEDKGDEDFKCDHVGEDRVTFGGPLLSIQDEMHLLSEGFGTISAHFEGLIETFVNETSKHKLKHIAMSATLNGTEKQIDELYGKRYFVIPGRCPEGVGSPSDFFFEKHEGPKRVVYGLKPNLRDNHYASLRTLLHFSEFIFRAQKELNSNQGYFCNKYNLNSNFEAQDMIKQYLIPLTYHLKKQDAYDMGRLKDAVVGDRLRKQFNESDIHSKVLTGDSNLDDLKDAIDNVRTYVKNYNPKTIDDGELILESIFATSVVSHGVDLNELNFMIFQGIPYSTSEYIQALSRVGRKNLGIVVLWFYPNRVRDDSFFRNFTRYHDSLDHQVRPIPINRSSRLGLKQTINSIFCTGIINYLSYKKGKPLYLKSHVSELTLKDKQELVEFVRKTYSKSGIDMKIDEEIEARINQIINSDAKEKEFFPNILTKSGEPFFRNQSGMRGIQKQLVLDIRPEDESMLKQKER